MRTPIDRRRVAALDGDSTLLVKRKLQIASSSRLRVAMSAARHAHNNDKLVDRRSDRDHTTTRLQKCTSRSSARRHADNTTRDSNRRKRVVVITLNQLFDRQGQHPSNRLDCTIESVPKFDESRGHDYSDNIAEWLDHHNVRVSESRHRALLDRTSSAKRRRSATCARAQRTAAASS